MELNNRPYHRIAGGHWSDALLIPLLPAGVPNDTTEVEDPMPTPKPVQTGYHRFRWIQDSRPGMDAEHLMRRYGIPVSSRHIPLARSDKMEVGFDVPKRQAVWAEYLLCRAGWCLITPLLDPTRHHALLEQAWRDGPTRPIGGGKIKRQGITAKFYGIMDEIIGIGETTRERTQPEMQRWGRTPPPPPPPRSISLYKRILRLLGFQ
jgi:hypothetical protein